MLTVKYKVKDILKLVKENENYPANKRWKKSDKDDLFFNDPRITDFTYVNFYKLYMLLRMFKITKVETVSIRVDYENKVVRFFNDVFMYQLKYEQGE